MVKFAGTGVCPSHHNDDVQSLVQVLITLMYSWYNLSSQLQNNVYNYIITHGKNVEIVLLEGNLCIPWSVSVILHLIISWQ